MSTARKVVTSHAYPPIPIRTFDWCAYYEGEEEAGNYGWGATEVEAIADFIENWAEYHDARLGDSERRIGPAYLNRGEAA